MADIKERRKTPRKAAPKTDSRTPDTRTPDTKMPLRHAPEDMRKQIEEAAYYRAKQRGFEPGHELEDWIQAESEVMQRNGLR